MREVKTFKINQKFDGIENLYEYLVKNIHIIEHATGIKIQKDLTVKPFCITAFEEITQRQILLFASKQSFPESLGELIVFAGAYNADIVVFFLQNSGKNYLMPMNWLQKICEKDYEFLVGQVEF